MRIFGREPAVLLTLIATAVRLMAAFWIDLNTEQQALLNAAATAAVGLIIAMVVKDGLVAAILGGVQAVLALAIGFGLNASAEDQAVIMSFAGAVVAMFVRTQVVAPVAAEEVTARL